MIIAIDGPAASGKGTLAARIAAHYRLPHLETGLLYRAVGRKLLDAGQNPADPDDAAAAAHALRPQDLSATTLREPDVDQAASVVAAIPAVRAALLDYQRRFAANGGVLDGRDIGTRIFPDADIKFFVTASLAARAARRWQQLQALGHAIDLATVKADIEHRDRLDATRAASPMHQAADAILLDTTDLTRDQAFAVAISIISGREQELPHTPGGEQERPQ